MKSNPANTLSVSFSAMNLTGRICSVTAPLKVE